jgi:hypothetical protein
MSNRLSFVLDVNLADGKAGCSRAWKTPVPAISTEEFQYFPQVHQACRVIPALTENKCTQPPVNPTQPSHTGRAWIRSTAQPLKIGICHFSFRFMVMYGTFLKYLEVTYAGSWH